MPKAHSSALGSGAGARQMGLFTGNLGRFGSTMDCSRIYCCEAQLALVEKMRGMEERSMQPLCQSFVAKGVGVEYPCQSVEFGR